MSKILHQAQVRGTLASRRRKSRMGYPKGRPRVSREERQRRAEERQRLAAWVRQAREQLGTPALPDYPAVPLTQAELATRLGVSRSLVALWERGAATPSHDAVAALAALLASR